MSYDWNGARLKRTRLMRLAAGIIFLCLAIFASMLMHL
jgi:hypothetical protein